MTSTTLITAIQPYIKIARFDHWVKNVFVIPGIVVALYARPELMASSLILNIVLALLAVGFVASSNYVINELLDAPFDALHPVKKLRPIPSGGVNRKIVLYEWIFLGLLGLGIAALLGKLFFITALSLWIMGCIYNIPPVRSKDKPYIDVLSESINNPLRLLLGWYCTGIIVFPPISLILAYWMVGAFFMAVKRFAEYRRIADPDLSARYRQSFKFYNEARLLISIIYYAVSFGLFFGIFLMRYRMELILTIPLIAGFIAWYIQLGLLENSPTQYPELLYKQKGFVVYCLLSGCCIQVLFFIDIPFLYRLFQSTIY
jgi:decaprenyl-phosphate phosphoribosyltransferase